jgi:hypothetical protein
MGHNNVEDDIILTNIGPHKKVAHNKKAAEML